MNKKLKLWDATMLVMGSMIGSGIFIVSSDIMRNLGSGWWLVIVWIITGVMTVAAAISYGELSAIFPKAPAGHARPCNPAPRSQGNRSRHKSHRIPTPPWQEHTVSAPTGAPSAKL